MDLADRGVLGDQLAVATSQVGHVAHEHQRTDMLATGPQRDGTHDQRDPLVTDLGVAVRPAAEHGAQGLLVGPAARGHQLTGHLGQQVPVEIARPAEPPVDRQRVRARVADPAALVDPHEAVTDARRVGVVAALPGLREVAGGDHRGQIGGALQVGQLETARRADSEEVGVAGDHRDHPPAPRHRDRLDPHGDVVAPLGVTLAHQPRVGVRLVQHGTASCRDEGAHDVVDVRRGSGGGAHLPGRPESLAATVGQPQHEVGEGQVGDDLPVGHQQLQHAHVGLVEVGVAADQLQQGRHRTSVGAPPGGSVRLPAAGVGSENGWQDGGMSTADWNRVRSAEMRVPEDRPLPDLTAELTTMLGSTDPVERDEIAYPILATWIGEGVYDDLLAGLGDGMAAGLTQGLGESGTDSVFRRSFSALVLAECIARDNEHTLLPPARLLEWGDRVSGWLVRERDVRGFVAGKGWAHAVAHGADAIGTLAGSSHFRLPELTVLLDVIADRVLLPTTPPLSSGEPDRLAAATMAVFRRRLVPLRIIEPWLARVTAAATAAAPEGEDPYLTTGNPESFLRALPLQVAFAPEPIDVRADLLLELVAALRTSNQAYLTRR